MSDKMFDEVGIKDGEPYRLGDWRNIAVHDENNIKGFFGPARWLSNFHKCEIEYEGLKYGSTEAAYQSAKCIPEDRKWFTTCTPRESKSLWKQYRRIDVDAADWDARKYQVMLYLTLDKYNKHIDLRNKLLETGDKYLEETNWWGDTYWGVDIRKGGQNNLGKILMDVRTFWKTRAK